MWIILYLPYLDKYNGDVIKWKHFPLYWPFVRGIHLSPVNSPHKGQWSGALIFFFDLCLNKRLSKQWYGWWFETPSRPLWRHCNDSSAPYIWVHEKIANDDRNNLDRFSISHCFSVVSCLTPVFVIAVIVLSYWKRAALKRYCNNEMKKTGLHIFREVLKYVEKCDLKRCIPTKRLTKMSMNWLYQLDYVVVKN